MVELAYSLETDRCQIIVAYPDECVVVRPIGLGLSECGSRQAGVCQLVTGGVDHGGQIPNLCDLAFYRIELDHIVVVTDVFPIGQFRGYIADCSQ